MQECSLLRQSSLTTSQHSVNIKYLICLNFKIRSLSDNFLTFVKKKFNKNKKLSDNDLFKDLSIKISLTFIFRQFRLDVESLLAHVTAGGLLDDPFPGRVVDDWK